MNAGKLYAIRAHKHLAKIRIFNPLEVYRAVFKVYRAVFLCVSYM